MILASDYDGTLCRGKISQRDREAISRFREAGNLFGVVTGRDFPLAYESLTGEGGVSFDFIIAMNGALAVNRAGDILFEKKADGTVLPHLFQTVLEAGAGHLGVVTGKTRHDFSFRAPEGDERYAPLREMDHISAFTHGNTWYSSEEEAERAVHLIRERHGKYVNPLRNSVCVDIPPVYVDKGTGVCEYACLMGIPHDEIWTAGDNYNDLAMLTRYRGCAMENGVQAAKDAAKGVYPDIASIIEEMMAL